MNEEMRNLENWREVTKGLYRYVIGAGACYEIHILTWNHKTDILSSNTSLYIVGDWSTETGESLFERELLYRGTLAACLEVAVKDDEENNK